jgi:branched-chain amino acid transport system ATP-binding protein
MSGRTPALSRPGQVAFAVIAAGVVLPWVAGAKSYQLVELENVQALIMCCVGLNVILGLAGQLFLGPSATLAVGAFVVAGLAIHVTALSGLWAMGLVGILAGAALGLIMAGPALRFRGFYLGITTLYVAVAVPSIAQFLSVTGGSTGLSLLGMPGFNPIVGVPLYEIGIAALAVLTWLSSRFARARIGRRMVVIGTSEELAASVGINAYLSKLTAFLIGSAMIGFASGFYVYSQQYVSATSTDASLSVLMLAACAIGGLGYVWGPIVGGIIVFAPSIFLNSLDKYQNVIFGTLLIVVVLAYPSGLAGLRPSLLLARLSRVKGGGPAEATGAAPVSADLEPTPSVGMLAGWDLRPAAVPLRATGLVKRFGGTAAVDEVSINIQPGVVHAIVGPNGSGKTTLLNLLSGFLTADAGQTSIGESALTGRSPRQIAGHGVARTFQTPKLLPMLSGLANIELGAMGHIPCSELSSLLALPRARRADSEVRERALGAASLLGLLDVIDTPASLLPHGTQRLVEVGRALAAHPQYLLLDEPAAGLSPAEVEGLLRTIKAVAGAGLGVALVEHNLPVVYSCADVVTVLDNGAVLMHGTPGEVANDPAVRHAYLGTDESPQDRMAGQPTRESRELLSVRGLTAGYGRMTAVSGIDLEVGAGEMVAVVGRNGAGKTTALHAIAGLRHGSNRGSVMVEGRELSEQTPWKIAAAGVALVPEGRRTFTQMTVMENLLLGTTASPVKNRDEESARLEHVLRLFPLLERALGRSVGDLSGGGQQMVAIGQALMGSPSVLMLDEPASGLAPAVVQELMATLRRLADDGLGVLFVDQSVERALASSDRVYAMDNGSMVVSGRSTEVSAARLTDIVVGREPGPPEYVPSLDPHSPPEAK